MAENIHTSDTSTKIICRSQHAVNVTGRLLVDSFAKCLDKNKDRTDQEKKKYVHRFEEIYAKLALENILVNGEALEVNAAETTPEYEPVDRQMEACINEELLPAVDDCVVKVARQRKTLPRQCCAHINHFSNHQALYMSKVKPSAEKVGHDEAVQQAKEVKAFISGHRLQEPCATLSKLTKSTPVDQDRALHLSQALEMEAANRNCPTAAAFDSLVSVGVGARHPTTTHSPGKRKFEPSGLEMQATSSKSAKCVC